MNLIEILKRVRHVFLQPKKTSKLVTFLKVILIFVIVVMSLFGVVMFLIMPTETIETGRIMDFHGFIEDRIKDSIKPFELLYKDDITITLSEGQVTRLVNGFINDKDFKRGQIDGVKILLEDNKMLMYVNVTLYKIPMGVKITGRPLLLNGDLALRVTRIDIGKLGFSSDKTIKALLERMDDFILSSFDQVYISQESNCIAFNISKDIPEYLKIDSIAVQEKEMQVTFIVEKLKLPGVRSIINEVKEELENLNIDMDDIKKIIDILPNRQIKRIQETIEDYFEQ
ncbi:MAG: hypothetical protein ACOYEJ_01610 [Mahellales bacterium]